MAHNSILTKDNLIHGGSKGKETKSCFCEGDETVDHLFFSCALARLCWGVFIIAFGLLSTPVKFAEVGPWIWKFKGSVRQTAAAGVAALF
jgi:hypothetical protein